MRLVPVELLARVLEERDDAPIGPPSLPLSGDTERVTDEVEVVHSDVGDVVRAPVGDFLPTVYFRLDARLVGMATAAEA